MSSADVSTAETGTEARGAAASGGPDRGSGTRAQDSGAQDTGSSDTGGKGTGTVAALGEPTLLQGYRLAGAVLFPASSDAEIRAAWTSLPDTVAAVLLTPAAAEVLAADLADPASPLTVVLPR